jgi:hypothetical protein
MPRDDFNQPTKRLIAERCGYVCAYPNCLAPTYGPAVDETRSVNIGVAAHITAAAKGGPRYDSSLSAEERSGPENGIWLCSTHAALIDRDVDRFPAYELHNWKSEIEHRAMKMLGQPRGCAASKLATVSPVARVGAQQTVLVNEVPMPYVSIFDVDGEQERLTWFVSAFVLQFSVQKNHSRANVIVEHLVVTVHETQPIPPYQPLVGVYPAEVSLYYVEIDANNGKISREFVPSRYYTKASETGPETQQYPPPIVLDDDVPAQIAIRFNAKTSAMYLISMDAILSCGDERERVPILTPQWTIFERCGDDEASAKQLVFSKAGRRCSFPGCSTNLFTDSGTFVGEICHIAADNPAGPRFDPDVVDVNSEDNLILLCPTHHELVDREPFVYTSQWLRTTKLNHELAVTSSATTAVVPLTMNTVSFVESLHFWTKNQGNKDEEFWQSFFSENPQVIAQAVPDHILMLGHKCYVGGKSIDNQKANLIDFLYVTYPNRNVVLVEIKTPHTPLIGKQYRTNAHCMTEELSGAIVQILNYRDELCKNYYSLQFKSPDKQFSHYDPLCLVLAGSLARENPSLNERRSFELFRSSLSGVKIITYDELFGKIKDLVDIFACHTH